MDVLGLGEYIRKQREISRLSLRKLSGLAGVSGTYLSQVERGLRKPSADILQGIAKGLRISAETLYVQAGFLEDRPVADVASAIMSDPTIAERQKQALVQIYEAFREETARSFAPPGPALKPAKLRPAASTKTRAASASPTRSKRSTASKKATAATAPQNGSRARARASKEG